MSKNEVNSNLLPNSVILVDNAAYHKLQMNLAPTPSSWKAKINWLSDHGIPFSVWLCQPELYYLIKLHKPQFKKLKIDTPLAKQG